MLALTVSSLTAFPSGFRDFLRSREPALEGEWFEAKSLNATEDHLGSIRVLTDEAGGVTERTTWGPWGERLEGGSRSRFGYTGHQTERESGLRYSVHRYLDPRNGRWTRRDSLGDVDGQNRYRYGANRPTASTDPAGTRIYLLTGAGGSTTAGLGILSGLLNKAHPDQEQEWVIMGRFPFHNVDTQLKLSKGIRRRHATGCDPAILIGYSIGGVHAVKATNFNPEVDFAFVGTIDPTDFLFTRDALLSVGSNVGFARNFYQREERWLSGSFVHGARNVLITQADAVPGHPIEHDTMDTVPRILSTIVQDVKRALEKFSMETASP